MSGVDSVAEPDWSEVSARLTAAIGRSDVDSALDIVQALDAQGAISPGLVLGLNQLVVGRLCEALRDMVFTLDDFRLLPQIDPAALSTPPPYDAAALVAPAGPNYRRPEYTHVVMPTDGVTPWFKEGYDLVSRELRIASLRGASIVGDVVITSRNTVLRETIGVDLIEGRRDSVKPTKKSKVTHQKTLYRFSIGHTAKSVRIVTEPTLFIGGERRYFACWMIHHFTKLFAVDHLDRGSLRIALPSSLWGNVVEMILATGIREDQLIFLNPDDLTIFDTLYLPTSPAFEFQHARSEALIPYQRVRESLADGQASPSKVYLSRADGVGGKQPKNEAAIVALLEQRGYTAIVPGRLSLAEKVRTLREAKIIVGAVGSGIFNALFADPKNKPHLVVLGGQYHGDLTIASLAPLLDGQISYVFGNVDATSFSDPSVKALAMADFEVDLGALAGVLDQIEAALT